MAGVAVSMHASLRFNSGALFLSEPLNADVVGIAGGYRAMLNGDYKPCRKLANVRSIGISHMFQNLLCMLY